MAKLITRPAALVNQGNLKLYTTSLRVADLLTEKFYTIERLDPENFSEKGYQRLLNSGRAKKLADYLIDGQEHHDAFLPTSILLATDKDIEFNAGNSTITIDVERVCPFSVVDGQHRIEGLKLAAQRDTQLMSFEVPVNIAVNLPEIHQMCHFLIVNTTQKSVDQAVEQRIYARLTNAVELEDVPNLPKWVKRIVERGDDEQAIKIVDFLNREKESPWLGKIEMANQDSKTATINQKSFVKAIKRFVLTANNPISMRPLEQQLGIFLNYWKSIASLLDIGEPTVLYKYNGVDLFCRFSVPFFLKLESLGIAGSFKVETMKKILAETFENVEGEYAAVGHPDWWVRGNVASNLNAGAIGKVNQDLARALNKPKTVSEIEL
jgi:DGQHR domain-containing protein